MKTTTVDALLHRARRAVRNLRAGNPSREALNAAANIIEALLDERYPLSLPKGFLACPCGHADEPWHWPRGGMCGVGAEMTPPPVTGESRTTPLGPEDERASTGICCWCYGHGDGAGCANCGKPAVGGVGEGD